MSAHRGRGDIEHLAEFGGTDGAMLEHGAEDSVTGAVLYVRPELSLGRLHGIHKTIIA
ncbi:hypothetical protein GCM10027449_31730 [Sinomonas notoginsengisoli]